MVFRLTMFTNWRRNDVRGDLCRSIRDGATTSNNWSILMVIPMDLRQIIKLMNILASRVELSVMTWCRWSRHFFWIDWRILTNLIVFFLFRFEFNPRLTKGWLPPPPPREFFPAAPNPKRKWPKPSRQSKLHPLRSFWRKYSLGYLPSCEVG